MIAGTQPVEELVGALATTYKMLVEDRGFTPHPDVRALFANWSRIAQLPANTPKYAQLCELTYTNALLNRGPTQTFEAGRRAFAANRDTADWLALSASNLVFLATDERPLTHEGIGYDIVLVVVTPAAGPQAMTKLRHAELELDASVKALHARGGRILRLVFGGQLQTRLSAEKLSPTMTQETWHTAELQADPTLATPRHVSLRSMTPVELARIPRSTLGAPIGDWLLTTDIIVRWYSFAFDQAVCIERQQLFEGGASYAIRRVVAL